MEKQKLFIRFLKEQKIYAKFLNNYFTSGAKTSMPFFLDRQLNDVHDMYIFEASFVWSTTNEGFEFWSIISNKWQILLLSREGFIPKKQAYIYKNPNKL